MRNLTPSNGSNTILISLCITTSENISIRMCKTVLKSGYVFLMFLDTGLGGGLFSNSTLGNTGLGGLGTLGANNTALTK